MLNDTQIPAPRVTIADSSQNNIPTREWFRFFNNLYEFIGLGSGVVPTTSGGTGITSYTTGDLLYASDTNVLSKLPVPGEAAYLGTDATNMPQWVKVAYGAFNNTTTQTAPASTPTGITFNNTDYSRNVSINGSKITVAATGLYSITFSLQLSNATATDDDAIVWLRVNDNNVANTASYASVIKSHGGVAGNTIMTVNLFYQFTAGDYFEIYGMSILGNITLKTYAAGTSPAYPVSPAAILTVSQII